MDLTSPEIDRFEGIVLRLNASGDADAVIHVLSETAGKIAVFASRARGGHKNRPAIDVLDFGNFETRFGKGNLPILKNFSPRNSFHRIRQHFEKLILASFLCETFDTGLPEGEVSAPAFIQLYNALNNLNDADSLKDSFRITYQALTQLLKENGILDREDPPSYHALLHLANTLEKYTCRKLNTKDQLTMAAAELRKEVSKNV